MPAFISSIGVANPPHASRQSGIADFMVDYLKLDDSAARNLRVLYRATGIQTRHSVLEDFSRPMNGHAFFKELDVEPTVHTRMQLFRKSAMGLATQAVEGLNASFDPKSTTHLITISCTGMYAPGLDIDLIQALGLPTQTPRTAINFMGCYAAFNGLKTADQIVRSNPDAQVLMVCLEMCSIHLQSSTDEDSLLSNALFGDGAAAVLITGGGKADHELELTGFYSDLDFSGKEEMGWFIGDLGFEMKLTSRVPDVIKEGISRLTHRLLEKVNVPKEEIKHYAIHPGGKRILQVIEEELGISKADNWAAHEILRDHGNMSSPTVLFVIKKLMEHMTPGADGHVLSFAFGPGLTLESMVLKSRAHA